MIFGDLSNCQDIAGGRNNYGSAWPTYSPWSSSSRPSTAFRTSTSRWHTSAVPFSFHHILFLSFWILESHLNSKSFYFFSYISQSIHQYSFFQYFLGPENTKKNRMRIINILYPSPISVFLVFKGQRYTRLPKILSIRVERVTPFIWVRGRLFWWSP